MTGYTPEELAAAEAAYACATPEERAEFERSQYYDPHPVALDFMMWREAEAYAALADRYEAASPAERETIAAQHPKDAAKLRRLVTVLEHTEFLRVHGFTHGELIPLNRVSEHIWRQVKACIEAGHIKPAP
jgi:predicted NAD-dependent protein-ADP-ribosyltransferase YbiA (DUF1768 family)